ncbi:MAG TPA: hydroxysqualene dehydroxylase HpnE [Caulobacteraceae bacterium]|nr:hydroxysqualene dehydroxylase HpnE [Caulobacteraceae bacterium]
MKALVIGAGLAGLSAGVELAARGVAVEILEAAAQAGGRCRSYPDPVLGQTIDNGNHLLLSCNRAALSYLERIGARDRLTGPGEAAFPFLDRQSGARWTIRANPGPIPWWLALPSRRVPGTGIADYLPFARLLWARRATRIDAVVHTTGPVYQRLLRPLLVAALNTEPSQASAGLAGAVLRESLARGGRFAEPLVAAGGLGPAFVDPALAFIEARGGAVRLSSRVRALEIDAGAVVAAHIGEARRPVDGPVILATPPWAAAELLPGLRRPDRFSAIVNGHFACAPPAGSPALVGLIGGAAEWVFAFPDRVSVTVSAADAMVDIAAEELAGRFWDDITAALGDLGPLPPCRIVKERRATFAATPDQERRRPGPRTGIANLFLAGDWTDVGLPATIEGAIRSGRAAAELVSRQ